MSEWWQPDVINVLDATGRPYSADQCSYDRKTLVCEDADQWHHSKYPTKPSICRQTGTTGAGFLSSPVPTLEHQQAAHRQQPQRRGLGGCHGLGNA